MNQAISTALQIPTEPGTPFEGGFYVGRVRVGDKTFALIVAPKDTGETKAGWQDPSADVPDAISYSDGLANTTAMAAANSPIATWARGLSINGFSDWYIPSRDELELLYRHLKPTTESNFGFRSGENPSSLPMGYPYTDEAPLQTSATVFQADGPEAFDARWHWSSTQSSRSGAWYQHFVDGCQYNGVKSYAGRARAVRRLVIE